MKAEYAWDKYCTLYTGNNITISRCPWLAMLVHDDHCQGHIMCCEGTAYI